MTQWIFKLWQAKTVRWLKNLVLNRIKAGEKVGYRAFWCREIDHSEIYWCVFMILNPVPKFELTGKTSKVLTRFFTCSNRHWWLKDHMPWLQNKYRRFRENLLTADQTPLKKIMIHRGKKCRSAWFYTNLTDPLCNAGLRCMVGERGIKLSGGQVVSVLRLHGSCWKNAPLLVLDKHIRVWIRR